MALTGRQEEAANFVASDEITNAEIAEYVGVSGRTLDNWIASEPFRARVNEIREDFKAAVRARGIAILENRVARLNKTRNALLKVVAERVEKYKKHDLPEARSGYYVPTLKLVKVYTTPEPDEEVSEELEGQPHGGALKRRRRDGDVLTSAKQSVEVVEWELEAALIKALNDAELQAAKELGQWIDRKSLDGNSRIVITTIEVED